MLFSHPLQSSQSHPPYPLHPCRCFLTLLPSNLIRLRHMSLPSYRLGQPPSRSFRSPRPRLVFYHRHRSLPWLSLNPSPRSSLLQPCSISLGPSIIGVMAARSVVFLAACYLRLSIHLGPALSRPLGWSKRNIVGLRGFSSIVLLAPLSNTVQSVSFPLRSVGATVIARVTRAEIVYSQRW